MSPSIPASAYGSLRSGLCIDIPNLTSASLQGSKTLPTTRLRSTNSSGLRSETKPVVIRTASEPERNVSNIRTRPMSGSHLLRSSTGMQGLLLAETGGGLVELDLLGSGSGFKQGTAVVPGLVTPGGTSGAVYLPSDRQATLHSKRDTKVRGAQRVSRHATLLSKDVPPARNAAELKSLLGNSRLKVKSGAKLLPPSKSSHPNSSPDHSSAAVTLEQGKSRARVEVDILLDTDTCVEGGYLTGKLHVRVRKVKAKESVVLMAEGKMRIVGFEGIPDNNDRHTFYQHAAQLSTISASSHTLYSSAPDDEGFSQASEGEHIVPFALKLPISEDIHVGAKGPFDSRSGVLVKYIAIASFKLKDPATSKHSIAHFYRTCEIYPYFNSTLILAPAIHPVLSAAARNVFLGGPGKLKLTANLHRSVWVAGQRCCVGIAVDNESKKAVKGLTLSLIRTTTIFRSRPRLDVASSSSTDPDACQTTTTRKLVAETTLEAGQRGLRGHVTEKGWWVGVDPGVQAKFTHFILLPHDTLSIVRSRLVEVSYAIRISLTAGSLSSEVSVILPLRIISNLSIDPPPSYPSPYNYPGVHAPAPLLPLAAVCSETAPCNSKYNANFLGDNKATVSLDLDEPISAFNEVITRGDVPASDSAIASASYGGIQSGEKSQVMPRLEGDIEIEDAGHCSPLSNRTWSDAPEDLRFCEIREDSDEENISGHIDGDNPMDEETVDDFTMDLLRNLDSDETDSLLGTTGTDEHERHDWEATPSELSEAECYDPETIASARTSSANMIESRKYTSPRLPRDLTQKINAITESRSIVWPKAPPRAPSSMILADECQRQRPVCSTIPGRGYLESQPRNANDEARTSKSRFSQRVERLVAAHRATAAAATLTNSESGAVSDSGRAPLVNEGTHNNVATWANQCSTLIDPQHCALGSSRSRFGCPSTLTSSTTKTVMSDRTAVGASFTGTVRSRIAALEGRSEVADRRVSKQL